MKTYHFLLLIFYTLLSSCIISEPLTNLYSPKAVNSPQLGEKGDMKAGFSMNRSDSLSIWQSSFAYSPVNKLAVVGAFALGSNKTNDILKLNIKELELGLGFYHRIYFKPEFKRNYFEIEFQVGGGYGKSQDWNYGYKRNDQSSFNYEWIFDQFDAKYRRTFMQLAPSIYLGRRDGKFVFEVIPITKVSWINMYEVKHVSDIRTLALENPNFTTLNLAPTIRAGHRNIRAQVQIGLVFPIKESHPNFYSLHTNGSTYELYGSIGLEYYINLERKKGDKS